MDREPEITPNCRAAARAGHPRRLHHCTGGICDCPCHHVPAPPRFRELVEAARQRPPEEDQ